MNATTTRCEMSTGVPCAWQQVAGKASKTMMPSLSFMERLYLRASETLKNGISGNFEVNFPKGRLCGNYPVAGHADKWFGSRGCNDQRSSMKQSRRLSKTIPGTSQIHRYTVAIHETTYRSHPDDHRPGPHCPIHPFSRRNHAVRSSPRTPRRAPPHISTGRASSRGKFCSPLQHLYLPVHVLGGHLGYLHHCRAPSPAQLGPHLRAYHRRLPCCLGRADSSRTCHFANR